MLDSMRTPLAGEEGQALVEYAFIISLVAIVCVVALELIGTNVSSIFRDVAGGI